MTTLRANRLLLCNALWAFLFIPIGSCENTDEYTYNAFVLEYHEIIGIKADENYKPKNPPAEIGDIAFYMKTDNRCVFNDVGVRKTRYDSLRIAHGDTTYTSRIHLYKDGSPGRSGFMSACYPMVSHINVMCDVDFDINHPAGSSLNDVVEIRFVSISKNSTPLNKIKLTNWEETMFRSSGNFGLKFLTRPSDLTKPYTFTVSITTSTGKTYSSNRTVRF